MRVEESINVISNGWRMEFETVNWVDHANQPAPLHDGIPVGFKVSVNKSGQRSPEQRWSATRNSRSKSNGSVEL